MVLVQDEYGELLGIVTTADILEAIVGAFQTDEGPAEPEAKERDDGSWLVAGSMPADELIELLGIPIKRTADFHTVAGMVLAAQGRRFRRRRRLALRGPRHGRPPHRQALGNPRQDGAPGGEYLADGGKPLPDSPDIRESPNEFSAPSSESRTDTCRRTCPGSRLRRLATVQGRSRRDRPEIVTDRRAERRTRSRIR